MKKTGVILILILMLSVCIFTSCNHIGGTDNLTEIINGEVPEYVTMRNPLGVTEIGDPFVLVERSTFYMYATSMNDGFAVWKGSNLSELQPVGAAYRKNESSFGEYNFWAPEVYKYGDFYYMFYSAGHTLEDGSRHMAIGCAKSSSPEGPFTDLAAGEPFYAPDYSVIDANVLFDSSGKIYMFYSRDCSENIVNGKNVSQIWGIELEKDLSGVVGEPVLLLSPEQDWETDPGDWLWNEGPCAFEINGKYYLTYSANYYENINYSVGYAVSSSPLGPYVKYENNPILAADGVRNSGSGHNNYFKSPDGKEIYFVYHTHTSVTERGGNRQLCADKIIIDEEGVLHVNGPSYYTVPVPSGTEGVTVIGNEEFKLSADKKIKTVSGKIDYAADGILKYSGEETSDCWIFEPKGGKITAKFEKTENISYILLYAHLFDTGENAYVSVTVNETYIISDIRLRKDGSPTLISFENLPEGTEIKTLGFLFMTEKDENKIMFCEMIPIA